MAKFAPLFSRHKFEHLLGGVFKDTESPGYRTNGFFATWKGYSTVNQEQKAVFVTDGKNTAEARTWRELASKIGLLKGQ